MQLSNSNLSSESSKLLLHNSLQYLHTRKEYLVEYDQTLPKLILLKKALPKESLALILSKCFPKFQKVFVLFIDPSAIRKNPLRIINFLILLQFSLENHIEPISLYPTSLKISRLLSTTLTEIDAKENKEVLEFVVNLLMGKLTLNLNNAQKTKVLQQSTLHMRALKLLASLMMSKNELIVSLINKVFLPALIICPLPKPAEIKKSQLKIVSLTYLNFGLGHNELFECLREIQYLDIRKLTIQLLENLTVNIEMQTQAWKHNKRLLQATHNIIKLVLCLSPSEATCSWNAVSNLLTLLYTWRDSNIQDITNPILKCYKDWKIIQTVEKADWRKLLNDLERLGSEKFVYHYLEVMEKTEGDERAKMTEEFASLCISMINFAKDYEDRMVRYGEEVPMEVEETIYKSTFEQNLLTHLSFGSKVLLTHLWDIIRQCKTRDSLVKTWTHTSQLFCKLYYQVIFVMDDMEFTGQVSKSGFVSLSFEELKWLCQVINETVFRLYIESIPNKSLFSLRYDALKLLKQLYDRARRNKMFPVEFWYLTHTKLEDYSLKEVLRCIPHVIPFDQRVKVLRKKLREEKDKVGGMLPVLIRRNLILEDAMLNLQKLGSAFKQDIAIEFTSNDGVVEVGAGNGLFKEFLTILADQAFSTEQGFFVETKDRELFPNPDFINQGNYQRIFEFLGMVVGKAIFEGILIQPVFSRCFLNKVLGKTNPIDDLKLLDPKLYENLMTLKYYKVTLINRVG